MSKKTAIIDLGSNGVRMSVYEQTGEESFMILRKMSSKVKLSEGIYENEGILQDFAMDRTIQALEGFLASAKALGVDDIRPITTSAVREAPNQAEFLAKAKEIGIDFNVLAGEDEGMYGGIAASKLIAQDEGVTIDIGGGSTEFCLIKDGEIVDMTSIKLGTSRLNELFISKGDVEGAKKYIQEELQNLPEQFKSANAMAMGGTGRAMGKVMMRNSDYPLEMIHGYSASYKEEKESFDTISNAKSKKELKKANVPKGRLESMQSGTLILQSAIEKIGAKNVIASEAGLREGYYIKEVMGEGKEVPNLKNPSLQAIVDKYGVDKEQSGYESQLGEKIFDETSNLHELDDKYKFHVKTALELSQAGEFVDAFSDGRHIDHILKNTKVFGITHEGLILIGEILRNVENNRVKKEDLEKFAELLPDQETVEKLTQIVWLTKSLNTDKSMPEVSVQEENGNVRIEGDTYLAKEQITKKRDKFFTDIYLEGETSQETKKKKKKKKSKSL